ncbi:short coiled-coil protein B [Galendromus occidentalis]|uniref:Short coiled-coil protein B n=1 Tax=Galendromus occidentalis TaxID=34638 RepID=A0AAJ6QQY2_9ACAR|nr:short coiled-coil protein B [Galendromus occidentalis]
MAERAPVASGLNLDDDIPLADVDGEEVKDSTPDGLPDVGLARSGSVPVVDEHLYFEEENHDGSTFSSLDHDLNADETEEKSRLISQVLELQNTLDDLSQRVDCVKEENLKLKSENQVLGQYIENLMSASSVFQSTHQQQQPPSRKK